MEIFFLLLNIISDNVGEGKKLCNFGCSRGINTLYGDGSARLRFRTRNNNDWSKERYAVGLKEYSTNRK